MTVATPPMRADARHLLPPCDAMSQFAWSPWDVREDLIERVREEIARGSYVTGLRLDIALEGLIADLMIQQAGRR